jgi:hypothetical protein
MGDQLMFLVFVNEELIVDETTITQGRQILKIPLKGTISTNKVK